MRLLCSHYVLRRRGVNVDFLLDIFLLPNIGHDTPLASVRYGITWLL